MSNSNTHFSLLLARDTKLSFVLVDADPVVGLSNLHVGVAGSMEPGELPGKADVDTLGNSQLSIAGSVVNPEALEWAIDFRGGKRVLVLGFNPRDLFSSYAKREVYSVGQKQEKVWSTQLDVCDARKGLLHGVAHVDLNQLFLASMKSV